MASFVSQCRAEQEFKIALQMDEGACKMGSEVNPRKTCPSVGNLVWSLHFWEEPYTISSLVTGNMHSFKHNHLPNLLSSFFDNISQFQLTKGFRAWTSQWLHLIFSPAHFFCALQIFCLTSIWPTNPGPTIWSSKFITKWTKCAQNHEMRA